MVSEPLEIFWQYCTFQHGVRFLVRVTRWTPPSPPAEEETENTCEVTFECLRERGPPDLWQSKISQHSGLGPRSAWRRSVLLWKAWKHSCVMCSRKTSWGVDVHMDPHANSLMMKFTGLRRFGGGSWGEGGVGVWAACELWFLTERKFQALGCIWIQLN